jgi:hypothetical protein
MAAKVIRTKTAAKTLKKTTSPPRLAPRFAVPWLPESQGQTVGEELLKIAAEHKINNIRSLDAKLVWAILKDDPNHPLWSSGGYERDVRKAATRYWVDHTKKLIASVRIITMTLPKRVMHEPLFLNCDAPVKKEGSVAKKRVHVLRADVLEQDPLFMSAIGSKIRRLLGVIHELEHLSAERAIPGYMQELIDAVSEATKRYMGTGVDVAAQ